MIRNGIEIGSNTTIGFSSLVMSNVPDGATVIGSPARPQEEFRRMLRGLAELAESPEFQG